MQEREYQLSLEELAGLVGLSVRTIRYYISEGLIPGPGGRGKNATYGKEHLLKLRLIRRLSEQHMPLAEMLEMLPRLTLAEIEALLADEEQRVVPPAQAPQESEVEAKEYIEQLLRKAQVARHRRVAEEPAPYGTLGNMPPASAPAPAQSLSQGKGEKWQRWELAPGVELHVREDAQRQQQRLLERLFRAVGMVFRASGTEGK